jgi:hypothetical protein
MTKRLGVFLETDLLEESAQFCFDQLNTLTNAIKQILGLSLSTGKTSPIVKRTFTDIDVCMYVL